jgi:hypothetical protein
MLIAVEQLDEPQQFSSCASLVRGFTLVELLVVIAPRNNGAISEYCRFSPRAKELSHVAPPERLLRVLLTEGDLLPSSAVPLAGLCRRELLAAAQLRPFGSRSSCGTIRSSRQSCRNDSHHIGTVSPM